MAYEIPGKKYTYEANADLHTNLFCAVKFASGQKIGVCGSGTSSHGDRMVGILQNKPERAGAASSVMVDGVSQAVAGAAVTVGARLKTTTGGKLIPVSDPADIVVATAETAAAADGDLISVRFPINA